MSNIIIKAIINTIYKSKNWRKFISIACIIFVIVMLAKSIISSWKLQNAIIFLIVFIVSYLVIVYWLKIIENKIKNKPVKLWKEFEKKYPIIVQYSAPKWINPAEAWLLYNCKVDVTDLTSLIYQWASEKIISIKVIDDSKWIDDWTKIQLKKLKSIDETRPFFEQEIFNSLFRASDIKNISNSFEIRYALLLEDLEFHWIRMWRVKRKSGWKWLKIIYFILVLLLILSFIKLFLSVFNSVIMLYEIIPSFSIFIILLSLSIFLWWYIYWWAWLTLTDKWAKLASHLIWYSNFIKSCDEKVIKSMLEADPLFIDKTLPYATAFWLETVFLNKVTPLKEDWHAHYVNWIKISSWLSALSSISKRNFKSLDDFFYHW